MLNPDAGNGETLCHGAPAGHRGRGTRRRGSAGSRKASTADELHDPGDLVAVAGGDGTVGRVMKALAGGRRPHGHPSHRHRQQHRHARSGSAVIQASSRRWWARAEVRAVDVGSVRGPWGVTRFVESVGVGLLAHLIDAGGGEGPRGNGRRAHRGPSRGAHPAGAGAAGRARRPRTVGGNYLLLEAMNIRCAGPNLWLADQARVGDGKLEIVRALERDRAALVALADTFGTSRPDAARTSGARAFGSGARRTSCMWTTSTGPSWGSGWGRRRWRCRSASGGLVC